MIAAGFDEFAWAPRKFVEAGAAGNGVPVQFGRVSRAGSSAVEQGTFNPCVVGSIPTRLALHSLLGVRPQALRTFRAKHCVRLQREREGNGQSTRAGYDQGRALAEQLTEFWR